MTTGTSRRPRISVVVEGYNQTRGQGQAFDTIAALRMQDFPVGDIEVILVGTSQQTKEWQRLFPKSAPFFALQFVAKMPENPDPQDATEHSYYALKNAGAAAARGEIIAFTDSDVRQKPTWLSAIAESFAQGADVAVGLSLFKDRSGWTDLNVLRWMAVSITFGYILGPIRPPAPSGLPWPNSQVRGFLDHNVAIRAELVRDHRYREEFGRVLASPLLFRKLQQAGARIVLHPDQQVVHFFTWRYWLHKLHFRYGFEVYRLRRLDPHYPGNWMRRTGILEPIVTMAWHMMLDVPRWLRFGRLRGISAPLRWALLPASGMMSAVARGTEMVGMYATLFAPERMRRWAEGV